jgi:hypothetical protein
MTEIEQKALALVNEVFTEQGGSPIDYEALVGSGDVVTLALCRAIEQHEAFKQEVSDIVEAFNKRIASHGIAGLRESHWRNLNSLIIPKPKPDLLHEVWFYLFGEIYNMQEFRAELEARGLEIREKGA